LQGNVSPQVAINDLDARMQGTLPFDDLGTEEAAHRVRAGDAGIQMQELQDLASLGSS
jgi:hypothetical protein